MMDHPYHFQSLLDICDYAYHPVLHYDTEAYIIRNFLWQWEAHPSTSLPFWERPCKQAPEYDHRPAQDIYEILEKAVLEGEEESRVFALFLLGGVATTKARDLLLSFLISPHRKERWASAIALGRLKEERVFLLLQELLLEGFAGSEIFAGPEELQAAEEACALYWRSLQERGQAECSETFGKVCEHLREIDYEWYLHQRAECALVLGAWGDTQVVPRLREALQAVWQMEQAWPHFFGPVECGPEIWYEFQDRLVYALGQLGVWDALEGLAFSESDLLVAQIYLVLGSLQGKTPDVFWHVDGVFHRFPWFWQREAYPLVEAEQVQRLLAQRFGLSRVEQDLSVQQFPGACKERSQRVKGTRGEHFAAFDPFEGWDNDQGLL